MTSNARFAFTILACTLMPALASSQTQRFDLSQRDPSRDVKAAFPAAKCIWLAHFPDAMRLADRLETGMKRKDVLEAIAALKPGCEAYLNAKTTDSRLLSAIIYTQFEPRMQCIARLGGETFTRFIKSIRKQTSEPAQRFIKAGFPADLHDAVRPCDPKLLVAEDEMRRGKFGETLFGWKPPYLTARPEWLSARDCPRYNWRTRTCS